jgi:hypothetical protein
LGRSPALSLFLKLVYIICTQGFLLAIFIHACNVLWLYSPPPLDRPLLPYAVLQSSSLSPDWVPAARVPGSHLVSPWGPHQTRTRRHQFSCPHPPLLPSCLGSMLMAWPETPEQSALVLAASENTGKEWGRAEGGRGASEHRMPAEWAAQLCITGDYVL